MFRIPSVTKSTDLLSFEVRRQQSLKAQQTLKKTPCTEESSVVQELGKPMLARYTSTLGEMFISNLLHLFDGDINIAGNDYSGSSSNSDSSSTSCSAESSTESDEICPRCLMLCANLMPMLVRLSAPKKTMRKIIKFHQDKFIV
ncbi:uncharacterized protein [Acropora muricata]|uniref:uncharacterized protein n=1 Tax=Acropora muricata TaxID=159855 RepID=UPI0034E44278